MKSKRFIVLGLMGALLLTGHLAGQEAFADGNNVNRGKVYEAQTQNLIGEEDAIKQVLKENPQWQAKKIELEKRRGKLIYKVEIVNKHEEKEYKIDAATGEVIRYETDKELLDFDSNADISLVQAIDIATKGRQNPIVKEAELKRDFDKLYYEVEFFEGKVKYEVKIDAKTGDLISLQEHHRL
ncbi:PepSY domain-containing protein [Fusobacterium sp.]|uniref:PepSY domain-containing protein n=1 Tax=Fusobacterium sp. TaxID=68766 RepID=UPI00396CE0BD